MNSTPEGDRGQLMLLAGVVLALVFVVLGVLLNSAAFTGAEAARGGASDAGDALSVRDDAVEGLGGALFYANYHNYSGGHGEIEDTLRADVRSWNDVLRSDAASHRTIGNVELRSATNGTQVYQTDTRNFTNADGDDGDWSAASNITGVRRGVVNVSAATLHNDSDELAAFHIEFKTREVLTDGEFYLVRFHEEGGNVVVSWRGDSVTNGDCDTGRESATVDLTTGDVPGTDCSVPPVPEFVDAFLLEFDNPNAAEGRYNFVVAGTVDGGEIDPNDYYAPTAAESPHQAPAIYNATIEVTHRTATLDYVTNATVAPETTPNGTTFGVA